MTRNYLQADIKLLWGWAAGRCSFPGCRYELPVEKTSKDPAAVISEIAHIVASSESGPRADASVAAKDRDRYENLILLCPTHHTQVDKQPNTYTSDDLRSWKRDHEQWVREQLTAEMPDVSFTELDLLTKGLLAAAGPESEEFIPLAPREKMERNGLTDQVRFELSMALSKAKEVREFLTSIAQTMPDFPERVKAGFVTEYRRQLELGITGDALFGALREFAAQGRREFRYQAAGLAVLAYLFEACEVFER